MSGGSGMHEVSAWDLMNHEELLADAKRQHSDKLDAERKLDFISQAIHRYALNQHNAPGAPVLLRRRPAVEAGRWMWLSARHRYRYLKTRVVVLAWERTHGCGGMASRQPKPVGALPIYEWTTNPGTFMNPGYFYSGRANIMAGTDS
jgi:hypothetical protein